MFLITPIDIDGTLYCCSAATRHTEPVLSGDAVDISTSSDEWEIYHAYADDSTGGNPEAQSSEVVTGGVKFGVCCASQVVLRLWGNIEVKNTGYDNIEVKLNGVREFFTESVDDLSGNYWATVPSGPHTVTLNLADRPCGHIIEISGSTVDDIANNDVWWRARIVSIT